VGVFRLHHPTWTGAWWTSFRCEHVGAATLDTFTVPTAPAGAAPSS